ncbi:MAG: hypothetical protein ABIO74_06460 [Dokdonella sp.]
MLRFTSAAAHACAVIALLFALPAAANSRVTGRAAASLRVPDSIAVTQPLGIPPAGVSELKFQDVFKLPIGPKGLEPTDRFLGLDGKRVRIVGYMVKQDSSTQDGFLFSPLPVLLGDEDESLADDLPPSTLRIELPIAHGLPIHFVAGLLQLTGVLHVGMYADAESGRATPARLTLDARPARAITHLARAQLATHAPR